MVYNANIHHRKSIRLKGYDYAQAGLYFITLCIENRTCLFGEIDRPDSRQLPMVMNAYGEIVKNTWLDLPNHVSNIKLHEFIVMPNHIHGIIEMDTPVGADSKPAQNGKPQPLPEIVRQLKTFSARRINRLRDTPAHAIWQRNYYEHIIRNEQAYLEIAEYIQTNPLQWLEDTYYCAAPP